MKKKRRDERKGPDIVIWKDLVVEKGVDKQLWSWDEMLSLRLHSMIPSPPSRNMIDFTLIVRFSVMGPEKTDGSRKKAASSSEEQVKSRE